MTQTVIETMRGVRITIDPSPSTKALEIKAILALVDSLIAEQVAVEQDKISDLTADLYSARLHIVRAIKEAA